MTVNRMIQLVSKSASTYLEPSDQVVAVFVLLEASESHLYVQKSCTGKTKMKENDQCAEWQSGECQRTSRSTNGEQ
jgi:hypothetical protein